MEAEGREFLAGLDSFAYNIWLQVISPLARLGAAERCQKAHFHTECVCGGREKHLRSFQLVELMMVTKLESRAHIQAGRCSRER